MLKALRGCLLSERLLAGWVSHMYSLSMLDLQVHGAVSAHEL